MRDWMKSIRWISQRYITGEGEDHDGDGGYLIHLFTIFLQYEGLVSWNN